MTADDTGREARLDELERRVDDLERRLVSRHELDEEIRSLEHRMHEVREAAEG